MKKIVSFLIFSVITISLIAYFKNNQRVLKEPFTNDIIKIVYNQLPEEQKESIDLAQTKIHKSILKDGTGSIYDKSYIGEEVYTIDFTVKEKNVIPNNKTLFATLDDYKVIGYGYVE